VTAPPPPKKKEKIIRSRCANHAAMMLACLLSMEVLEFFIVLMVTLCSHLNVHDCLRTPYRVQWLASYDGGVLWLSSALNGLLREQFYHRLSQGTARRDHESLVSAVDIEADIQTARFRITIQSPCIWRHLLGKSVMRS
jgi:hypothetical protein